MHITFIIIFILLLLTFLYYKLFELSYDCKDKHIKKKYGDYIKSAHSGLIRGVMTGLLLGVIPLESAIKNAAIFGTINPLIMHMGY